MWKLEAGKRRFTLKLQVLEGSPLTVSFKEYSKIDIFVPKPLEMPNKVCLVSAGKLSSAALQPAIPQSKLEMLRGALVTVISYKTTEISVMAFGKSAAMCRHDSMA